jgi:hypothetical protein
MTQWFPRFAARACPFGYDWLGRQFAVDAGRIEAGEPLVLLVEPGTGEVLEVPFTFAAFHEQLRELKEPALAASFFDAWARVNEDAAPLSRTKCADHRVPLFLGGKDTAENLEVCDFDVYWSIWGQLRAQAMDLGLLDRSDSARMNAPRISSPKGSPQGLASHPRRRIPRRRCVHRPSAKNAHISRAPGGRDADAQIFRRGSHA